MKEVKEYQCDVCGARYGNEYLAHLCESLPVAEIIPVRLSDGSLNYDTETGICVHGFRGQRTFRRARILRTVFESELSMLTPSVLENKPSGSEARLIHNTLIVVDGFSDDDGYRDEERIIFPDTYLLGGKDFFHPDLSLEEMTEVDSKGNRIGFKI